MNVRDARRKYMTPGEEFIANTVDELTRVSELFSRNAGEFASKEFNDNVVSKCAAAAGRIYSAIVLFRSALRGYRITDEDVERITEELIEAVGKFRFYSMLFRAFSDNDRTLLIAHLVEACRPEIGAVLTLAGVKWQV